MDFEEEELLSTCMNKFTSICCHFYLRS